MKLTIQETFMGAVALSLIGFFILMFLAEGLAKPGW